MTQAHALELLESVHEFPGPYTIKAIGRAQDDFVGRIVSKAQEGLTRPDDVAHTTRLTPNGEHVSVTLDLAVRSASEVVTVYQALQSVHGLKFLL